MTNTNELFFCYSINLYNFLKKDKQLNYILTGKHIKTDKQFWVFNKNQILLDALDEYKENGKVL